jgi:hypothetical protein
VKKRKEEVDENKLNYAENQGNKNSENRTKIKEEKEDKERTVFIKLTSELQNIALYNLRRRWRS